LEDIEKRLSDLGLKLPRVPEPVAEYVPAKRSGDLIFVSGQGPTEGGEFVYQGRLGKEITLKEGYQAARLCTLNCLAAVKSIAGTLENVEEIVKIRGFVSSADNFTKQPEVIDGASELLVELFGARGQHARAALGTSVLPRNIPVELEMTVQIKEEK